MNQEDLNEIMWKSLPEWRKQQLHMDREYNYETLYTEINQASNTSDKCRKIAREILSKHGMREAIIDELKAMGFEIKTAI